jgi:hypothetical protein
MTKTFSFKTFTLAASMMMLVAISGQAFAGTAAADTWRHARASTDRQAMHAYNMAPPVAYPNTHPYHGGPKSND